MMQVDVTRLMAGVQKVPHFNMPDMDMGTSYLFNQVYSRLAAGETVALSGLDFSAFEEDDIYTFEDLYENVIERNNLQANDIARTLRRIAPTDRVAVYI